MWTGGSPCPFAGLTTADVPTVLRIFNLSGQTIHLIFDQPMGPFIGDFDEANQFMLKFIFSTLIPFRIRQISSTMIALDFTGTSPGVDRCIYTPGVAPLLSRLGGELEAFDEPVPFP